MRYEFIGASTTDFAPWGVRVWECWDQLQAPTNFRHGGGDEPKGSPSPERAPCRGGGDGRIKVARRWVGYASNSDFDHGRISGRREQGM